MSKENRNTLKWNWHTKVWNASSATATPVQTKTREASTHEIFLSDVADAQVPSSGVVTPSWLPSAKFAQAWLVFETAKEHPITPLE